MNKKMSVDFHKKLDLHIEQNTSICTSARTFFFFFFFFFYATTPIFFQKNLYSFLLHQRSYLPRKQVGVCFQLASLNSTFHRSETA